MMYGLPMYVYLNGASLATRLSAWDIQILRYFSGMSHTMATGKRLSRNTTSKMSRCSLGTWCILSFMILLNIFLGIKDVHVKFVCSLGFSLVYGLPMHVHPNGVSLATGSKMSIFKHINHKTLWSNAWSVRQSWLKILVSCFVRWTVFVVKLFYFIRYPHIFSASHYFWYKTRKSLLENPWLTPSTYPFSGGHPVLPCSSLLQ